MGGARDTGGETENDTGSGRAEVLAFPFAFLCRKISTRDLQELMKQLHVIKKRFRDKHRRFI